MPPATCGSVEVVIERTLTQTLRVGHTLRPPNGSISSCVWVRYARPKPGRNDKIIIIRSELICKFPCPQSTRTSTSCVLHRCRVPSIQALPATTLVFRSRPVDCVTACRLFQPRGELTRTSRDHRTPGERSASRGNLTHCRPDKTTIIRNSKAANSQAPGAPRSFPGEGRFINSLLSVHGADH